MTWKDQIDEAHNGQTGHFKTVEVLDWIRKNKNVLSVRGIEQALKMPDTTLTKAVNGAQKLPRKWEDPLKNFVENLKK